MSPFVTKTLAQPVAPEESSDLWCYPGFLQGEWQPNGWRNQYGGYRQMPLPGVPLAVPVPVVIAASLPVVSEPRSLL